MNDSFFYRPNEGIDSTRESDRDRFTVLRFAGAYGETGSSSSILPRRPEERTILKPSGEPVS